MPTMDQSCLVSTLRNISGGTKKFGFIPPHGKEMADNEEVSIVGNILEAVGRGDRDGTRERRALVAALHAGDIQLVNTPSPVLEDEDGSPVTLIVSGGAVEIDGPCWESLSGAWPD